MPPFSPGRVIKAPNPGDMLVRGFGFGSSARFDLSLNSSAPDHDDGEDENGANPVTGSSDSATAVGGVSSSLLSLSPSSAALLLDPWAVAQASASHMQMQMMMQRMRELQSEQQQLLHAGVEVPAEWTKPAMAMTGIADPTQSSGLSAFVHYACSCDCAPFLLVLSSCT